METSSEQGSITGILTREHRRLDELWNQARSAFEGDAPGGARARMEAFGTALRDHIRDEEEILFPAFEERTGMSGGGPTMVMRMEHREMETHLDAIMVALEEGGDLAGVVERASEFFALLDSHDQKEERMLYPMMDRAFGQEQGAALLARTSLSARER
jgi:iron-sulfur cluster repair protein YtfE (RIC family)